MPTILELATQAEVTPEQVLRVVNREPVSDDVARRVERAMEALGRPAYPRGPAAPPAALAALEPAPGAASTRGASELVPDVAVEVGSVVYEAVRVEVRPVTQHLAGLQSLFDGLVDELRRLRAEVEAERRERVEDLALQVELLRASWVGVDRRLGRIERALERKAEPDQARSALSAVADTKPAGIARVTDAHGSRLSGGQQ